MDRFRMGLAAQLALAGLLYVFAHLAFAQSPLPLPKPDLHDWKVGGIVYATARQTDGGTIIGGLFSTIDGVPRSSLARLLPDGTLDPDWFPSVSPGGIVLALAIDADGSVLVGGLFDSVSGFPRSSIAKISGSGAGLVDPDWNPNAFFGVIRSLLIDGSGSVYVGGDFFQVGGQSRSNLARISTAGTGAADSWDPSPDQQVWAMALDGAGNLFVGGQFSQIGGEQRSAIAKISTIGVGQADDSWNPSVTGYSVYRLVLDGMGNIFLGGEFSMVGSFARSRIAKVSASGNGAVDPAWDPSANDNVYSLFLDGDGKLIVGGEFGSIGGQIRDHVAMLDPSGSGAADGAWNPGADEPVWTIQGRGDGSLLAGGWFDRLGGSPRLGLASISVAGVAGSIVDAELGGGYPKSIAIQADGGTLVGGYFSKVDGVKRLGLLRLTPGGELDMSWDPAIEGAVTALAVADDGSVYVGGAFEAIGGTPRNHIAKLDAAGHLDPDWNPAASDYVGLLTVDSSASALYVAGSFEIIGGLPRNGLAKLALGGSGQTDPVWNPAPDGNISAIAHGTVGGIYVAGNFSSIGGQPRSGLAKLSGSGSGLAVPGWNPGVNSLVYGFAVDTNDDVYVGGEFFSIGGLPRSRIARINSAGIVDPIWNPSADSLVSGLALRDDAVYAVGEFTMIGGSPHARLARLAKSGTGLANVTWNPSPSSGRVTEIAADVSGPIRIGGEFQMLAGQARSEVAFLPPTQVSVVVASQSDFAMIGGVAAYRVTIGNSGSTQASAIDLSAILPSELPLAAMNWTCVAGAGSSCGAFGNSGSGALPSPIDVAAGETVEFLYSGSIQAGVSDEARLSATATYQGEPLTASSTTRLVIFRNGFDPQE